MTKNKKIVSCAVAGAVALSGLGFGALSASAESSPTSSVTATGELKATAELNSATSGTLKWTDSTTGLKGFKVARDGKDSSSSGAWGTTVSASTKSFQFTKLITGNTYKLTVTQVKADGSDGKTVTVLFKAGTGVINPTPAPTTPAPTTPAPTTPATSLKATVASSGSTSAKVNWTGSTANLKGFKVERDGKDSSGSGAWGTTVSATTKTFEFTKLITGNTYNFTVTEIKADGSFGAKSVATYKVGSGTVTPAPTVPTTPPPTSTAPTPKPSTPAPTTPAPTNPTNPGKYPSGHPWMSGAAGVGVGTGAFGNWRGAPVDIVTTWSNDDANAANFWQLQSGGEYGNWNGPIDISVGAFDNGGSWAAGANGSYDAKWRQSLTKLKSLRQGKGTTYIRFAHEMNGYWFPWNVKASDKDNFIKSWQRYRAIQKEVFPEAKLVFSVNKESNGLSMDWRKIVPGYAEGNVKAYVDAMSVDYYNNWPYAATLDQFNQQALDTDGYGAPKGIERHRQFAQSVGLPLVISEWSGNADDGDSPAYMQGMYNFFQKNAGTGSGNLLYETIFNVDIDNHRWIVYGGQVRMQQSATAYKNLF